MGVGWVRSSGNVSNKSVRHVTLWFCQALGVFSQHLQQPVPAEIMSERACQYMSDSSRSDIESIRHCLAEIDNAIEIIVKNRVCHSTPQLGA